MDRRAVSPVLGLVLLVGITAAGSVALLAVGAEMTDGIQSTVQTGQAEDSLSAVAASADGIAAGETDRETFSIEGAPGAAVYANETVGTVTINHSASDFNHTTDLGALVYEDDGTTIAYQGGGVWKVRDGRVEMVRAPQFQYRGRPTPTLTFPVVNVTGTYGSGVGSDGELGVRERRDVYPTRPEHYNPIMNGTVFVDVESEYCEGWERYFEQRTDGALQEACGEGDPDRVRIELAVPFTIQELDGGIMVGDGDFDHEDHEGVDHEDVGDVSEAQDTASLVESKLEDAEDADTLPSGGEVAGPDPGSEEPRLYYADGNFDDERFEFNTTNGDIEVVADSTVLGSFDASDGIDIEGDGNVSVFVKGDLMTDTANARFGHEGDESQLRFFVHSDGYQAGPTNAEIHALIYAPGSSVEFQSASSDFTGAIVAEDLDVHHNRGIEIPEEVLELDIEYGEGGDSVYYLHVSETVVEIEED